MRLINQEGTLNFPYGHVCLLVDADYEDGYGICIRMIGDSKWICMAWYPEKYQAEYAMKDLNLHYNLAYRGGTYSSYQFPTVEEIKKKMVAMK